MAKYATPPPQMTQNTNILQCISKAYFEGILSTDDNLSPYFVVSVPSIEAPCVVCTTPIIGKQSRLNLKTQLIKQTQRIGPNRIK